MHVFAASPPDAAGRPVRSKRFGGHAFCSYGPMSLQMAALLLLLLLQAVAVVAKVELPAWFGDNMGEQRFLFAPL